VKITDQLGCFSVFNFEIEAPDSLYLDILEIGNCVNGGDGSIDYSVIGGNDGDGNGTIYSYLVVEVSTGNTWTSASLTNLDIGDYIIEVTNDLGCVIIEEVSIGYLGTEELELDPVFRIFPSFITDGVLNIVNPNYLSDEIEFIIFDVLGQKVVEVKMSSETHVINLDLANGEYYFIIINEYERLPLQSGKFIIMNE